MKKILSGPQRKFCEGIAAGLTQTESYLRAYPENTKDVARKNAPRLMTKEVIRAEIGEIRRQAAAVPGSAVLTLSEKRNFVARLLRANPTALDYNQDGDLLAGLDIEHQKEGRGENAVTHVIHKLRMCDKLKAIEIDNDLAGEGSEAIANDSLSSLIARVQQ